MGSPTDVGEPKTQALRRDIERTQGEMSGTIHEIQRRLSPRYMFDQTKESVRRTGVSTSQKLIAKVKENPIPAAMVGVGLWLLMRDSGADDEHGVRAIAGRDFRTWEPEEPSTADRLEAKASATIDDVREKATHLADSVREKASGAADTAKEKAADLAETTRETASHVAGMARRATSRARQQSRDLLRDSPLVAALAALALGGIIAAVIPETEKEDELLGETRDRLLDRGKDLAREGIGKVKRVASAATEAAKDEARASS